MSGAIAVFVKTPGLSQVKTRLAAKIGKQSAEDFHLASTQAVVSVVQELCNSVDVQGYYAVAESAALNHDYWQNLPCVWQGDGGLGERMAHIYQALLAEHDFVILVGADIPQMTCAELLVASTWLLHDEQARFVFAPSIDGGFWAFGGNFNIPYSIWTEVVYSNADTGVQFFNKIDKLGDVKMLASLRDVDEERDLLPCRDALLSLAEPLPEQHKLIRFLDILQLNHT